LVRAFNGAVFGAPAVVPAASAPATTPAPPPLLVVPELTPWLGEISRAWPLVSDPSLFFSPPGVIFFFFFDSFFFVVLLLFVFGFFFFFLGFFSTVAFLGWTWTK
jgi:hypothetical protein